MGRGRQPCCDKSKVKKGPWSPAEDLKLITYIQKHGHDNWRALPARAGLLRCGKSCRLRWVNYLRPDVKRGNFTKEEENMIIHLHEILGNKWSKIACHFPGRTDNEIKNVWNTHLKRRTMIDTNASKEQSSNSNSKESTLTSSSLSSSASFNSNRNQVGVTGNEYSMNQGPLDKNSLEEFPRMSHYSQDAPGFAAQVPTPIIPGNNKEESPRCLTASNSNAPKISQAKVTVLEKDMDSAVFNWELPGSEVRFGADSDVWNDMELDNWIDSFQFGNGIQEGETYQPCQSSKTPEQSGNGNVDQEWFRYLENELGLDSPGTSQNNGAITSPDQQLASPNSNHFDALANLDIHSMFPDFAS